MTSKAEAIRNAIKNLNDDEYDLIADIEESIQYIHPENPSATGRGGDYTERVRNLVMEKYRKEGWTVRYDGYYWIGLI